MVKAVILIGNPAQESRFKPLSLDIPKPLLPIAGLPIIEHHIKACAAVPHMDEVLILGSYPRDTLEQFILKKSLKYKFLITFLYEFTPRGTAGGLYEFRDVIKSGNPKELFFVINGDVCADFPLREMYDMHQKQEKALATLMVTEATRQQSMHYGCIARDKDTGEVTHYVEKPGTFVSNLINCGVYVFSKEILDEIERVFDKKQADYDSGLLTIYGTNRGPEVISLEMEILLPLAGAGRLFAYETKNWWSQLKTAGSAIYANRHYLALYKENSPERLAKNSEGECKIIGDVYIHPTASVDPSAVLGPNVSIEEGVVIEGGVRVRESIILSGAVVWENAVVLHSIIGVGSHIGHWTRVEGTPCDPNPDKPFAKFDNSPLFNSEGRLNPSITVLAKF